MLLNRFTIITTGNLISNVSLLVIEIATLKRKNEVTPSDR